MLFPSPAGPQSSTRGQLSHKINSTGQGQCPTNREKRCTVWVDPYNYSVKTKPTDKFDSHLASHFIIITHLRLTVGQGYAILIQSLVGIWNNISMRKQKFLVDWPNVSEPPHEMPRQLTPKPAASTNCLWVASGMIRAAQWSLHFCKIWCGRTEICWQPACNNTYQADCVTPNPAWANQWRWDYMFSAKAPW